MRLCHALGSALVTAMVCSLSATASDLVVNIDEFSVTRNGTLLFTDGFANGAPPPSAPDFIGGTAPATYGVVGSFPPGSESGGKLILNTANGALTGNAVTEPRRLVAAVLQTSTDSTNFIQGFKSDDTLAFTGIFDLTTPAGPLYAGYGLQVGDFQLGAVQQLAQLAVQYAPNAGTVRVSYLHQDFVADTITSLGNAAFAPPAGADQIQLTIERPTTTGGFFGSFAYLSGGVLGASTTFGNAATLFQGEEFVRGRFFASVGLPVTPIPEPETYAMMLAGLGLLGFIARRRQK